MTTEPLKPLVALRHKIILAQASVSNPYAPRSVDVLTRHIRLLGKFFRRVQELSSPRFVTLPGCVNLVAYYWEQVVEATKYPDSIAGAYSRPLFLCPIFYRPIYRFSGSPLPGAVSRPRHGSLQGKSQPMETNAKRWHRES